MPREKVNAVGYNYAMYEPLTQKKENSPQPTTAHVI